jgi:regulatory protein YycI of two-component signal transduction system YycFG
MASPPNPNKLKSQIHLLKKPNMEKAKTALVVASVLLNLFLGFLFLQTAVYQAGFNQGQIVVRDQVNELIKAGQLTVNNQQNEQQSIDIPQGPTS